jgi:hypothetical protein
VKLQAAQPLSLELLPGDGFQKRFDGILTGTADLGDRRSPARTLVLRTLVAVVRAADLAGLRVWLPDVDVDLLFDSARRGEVLFAYQVVLNRKTTEVIESMGHRGLSAFPPDAYADID